MKTIESLVTAAIILTIFPVNADYLSDMDQYIQTKSMLSKACSTELDRRSPGLACNALVAHIDNHPGEMPSAVAKQIKLARSTVSIDHTYYDRLNAANKAADFTLSRLDAVNEAHQNIPEYTMTDGFRPPRMLGVTDNYFEK